MGRIRLLDTLTANKIAAGEVVERPASVVKELAENALDAGAHSIDIKVVAGGKEKITVVDDGEGMSIDDAVLAFKRHSTSKIRSAEDLSRIATLGFRGEALASIAAVAQVTLCTRTNAGPEGWQLKLEAGTITQRTPAGCARGTMIEVSDLFFNTPARKKFLASTARETAAISECISRLALAHPQVRFNLRSGSRVLLSTPGSGSLLDAVAAVYGLKLAEQLLGVKYQENDVAVEGYISPAPLHRATAGGITFFLNGRFIKDAVLTELLREAYSTRLPARRFPYAVLHLAVDPSVVDVNVHPQKLSVKFNQPESIANCLRQGVETALLGAAHRHKHIPAISQPLRKPDGIIKPKSPAASGETETARQEEMSFAYRSDKPEQQAAAAAEAPAAATAYSGGQEPSTPPGDDIGGLNELRVLGQFHASYIIAESGSILYLIDQHAAHERILFEKYAAAPAEAASQTTVPQTIELSTTEAQRLAENIFILQELGFLLEHFGGSTFLIRAVPSFLTTASGAEVVRDLVAMMAEGQTVDKQRLRKDVLLQSSCKGAVKAGQYLDNAEMQTLLKQLAGCRHPFSCPHGRPTVLKFPLRHLEKYFLRQDR